MACGEDMTWHDAVMQVCAARSSVVQAFILVCGAHVHSAWAMMLVCMACGADVAERGSVLVYVWMHGIHITGSHGDSDGA